VKPLFIPLKTKYFEAFENGSKDTEYRPYGKRWNERTCPVGRPVVLSRGYGKQRRLEGVIERFAVDPMPMLMKDWCDVYGDDPLRQAACIQIRLAQPQDGKQT